MHETYPPVFELLPHQGPAVLIDEVLNDSENSISVAANVTREHPFFVTSHGVPSWVGIELMAQAIAAHAGLSGRRLRRPPRVGMLLGTRRYLATTSYFEEGSRLEIKANREFGDTGGIAACKCSILCEGRTLAEASLIIIEIGPEGIP
jgi:predicted hotdog family 3-hydroxylacyl-ACP dehydratase